MATYTVLRDAEWGEVFLFDGTRVERGDCCQNCGKALLVAAIPSDDPHCLVLLCAPCLRAIANDVEQGGALSELAEGELGKGG